MIKVAIVGMGGIGNNHARCYNNNKYAKVVAVVDIVKDLADKAAAEHGAKAFYSVKDLIKSGMKIDAASVTTAGVENGSLHYKPTMELLDAGIPVLGEKPISNKIPEARRMVKKAKDKKLPYAINLNHRFTPAAHKAKEWLSAGRLGELNMINMMMWINNPNESSPHFHIRALHPHSIDVMRYFCGDVKKVHAFFKKGHGRKIWSNVQVNMLFKSGVIGHLGRIDNGGVPGHAWGLETCELIGHEARVVIRDACEVLEFQPRKNPEAERYECLGGMKSFGETFQSRINQWIEDLRKKVKPDKVDGKGEDALKAQLIIEAAVKSWETNKVVTL